MKELTHLKQKVRIIAFLELLFEVDKDDRSLSFKRIADTCKLEMIDVELLVMKAMSLELVKGLIDEKDEVVHINWIMPRYLSSSHLQIMIEKFKDWEGKVDGAVRLVEAGDIDLNAH